MNRPLKTFSHVGLILIIVTQLNLAVAADVNLTKVHPRFRLLLKDNTNLNLLKKTKSDRLNLVTDDKGATRIGVLIRTNNPAALDAANIHYNSVVNDVVTAKITLEELKKISLLPDVDYIDRPSTSYPATNVSLAENGTLLLQNGALNNIAYKGEGAIVLIFDTGIDFNHIDFKNPQDTTQSRILYIWDQTLTALPGESKPSGFNYGVEYTKSDIDDEIDGSPKGYVREVDSNGHGSHVAGTAAGSGSKFRGAAPEADLLIVKGGNGSFSEGNIIDALNYADQKATQLGKPVVVNLSLGGQDGPHDGSSTQEQQIDNFCSKSGRVVVVSAGNDGESAIHTSGSIAAGGSTSFQISVPAYTQDSSGDYDEIGFNVWYDGNASVSAMITSPNNFTYTKNHNSGGSYFNTSDGNIYLENYDYGGKQAVKFSVSDGPAQGTWTLQLSNASSTISYDGWLSSYYLGSPQVKVDLVNGNDEKSVGMPGTAQKAITVGAYVTKTSWPSIDGNQYGYSGVTVGEIASFSSQGPTRDGRQKPDLTAPGMGIVAALSGSARADFPDARINPDNKHFLIEGTSMSAPHVSGAAALLLSVQPSLTVDQLKDILIRTTKNDNFTGNIPNSVWGYGKMNILQAMNDLQSSSTNMATIGILDYTGNPGYTIHDFIGTEKMAMRCQAPFNGQISGAYLTPLINETNFNPIISGNGNLLTTIYSDNAGYPGIQIGQTVSHPLSLLDAGTDNYINLLPAQVSVESGDYYHMVFSLSNSSDTITLRFDDGTGELQNNYSEIYVNGQWQKYTSNQLLFKSEILQFGDINTVEETNGSTIQSFALNQNYPNPFNPSTNIQYMLTKQGPVTLTIFDVLGREIITLVDEAEKAGMHEVIWNGKNKHGIQVPTGIYFYRLKSDEGIISRKMLLVK